MDQRILIEVDESCGPWLRHPELQDLGTRIHDSVSNLFCCVCDEWSKNFVDQRRTSRGETGWSLQGNAGKDDTFTGEATRLCIIKLFAKYHLYQCRSIG